MKLDPVFVVAPQARPAMMPTRRAALLAIGSGIVGVAIGYSVQGLFGGNSTGRPTVGLADPRLQWALTLAHPATPDAELLAEIVPFLAVVQETTTSGLDPSGPEVAALLSGVERLAIAVLANPRACDRASILLLLQTLAIHDTDPAFAELRAQLRKVAR